VTNTRAGQETAPRPRNRRGEGSRLRAEILDAAAAMIEEEGGTAALSLRAIARRIGVTAPAIYTHFEDVAVIVTALIDQTFEALADSLEEAMSGITDPERRLYAECLAYVRFARERPGRYALLFGPGISEDPEPEWSIAEMPGARAFGLLRQGIAECVSAGVSASDDVVSDSIALWCALHGYVALSSRSRAFPWPPQEVFVLAAARRNARLADHA